MGRILCYIVSFFRKARPDVIVDFEFDRGLLFIAVVNIGAAPACRVSVKFEPEISGVEGSKRISEMALFRHLAFMPPGKKITGFLDTSASYFAREQPLQVRTDIRFHNMCGKGYRNRITHNPGIYRDLGYVAVSEGEEQSGCC